MLQKMGHKVHVANDGLEAIETLETKQFDVIFMDLQMPNMDGAELCKWVRDRDLPQYIYFVLITAHERVFDVVDGLDAGADLIGEDQTENAQTGDAQSQLLQAANAMEHGVELDEVFIQEEGLEGYVSESSKDLMLALNVELDEDLRREGLAREVVKRRELRIPSGAIVLLTKALSLGKRTSSGTVANVWSPSLWTSIR